LIGLDWGTTSLRAYRMGAGGAVLEQRSAARGILSVPAGGFPAALREIAGDWISAGETRVLLSGMVGSRQGWQEVPYLPCPVGPEELARALVVVPFEGAAARLIPGVSGVDGSGIPEVMRGEETQIAGAIAAIGETGLVCLPGSHSKWVRIAAGRIAGYTTHLTGEAFAALREHTILGRMMRDAPHDAAAFDRGVARAGTPGGLLHHLFGVRTLGLFGQLGETEAASYLSGLLIGHEIREALPANGGTVVLIGAAPLASLYARAIGACGGQAQLADEYAAARGLARIGELTEWN
jgi:2-dehydro-3-deoxygalactonokinase